MYSIRCLTCLVAFLCGCVLLYLVFGFSVFEKQYARRQANDFSERMPRVETFRKPVPSQEVVQAKTDPPELLHERLRQIVQNIRIAYGPKGLGERNPRIDEIRERFVREYEKDMEPLGLLVAPWETAKSWIHPGAHVVPPDAPQLGSILEKLGKAPIIRADIANKGTQLKLVLTFEGGQRVLFKPMFYSREHIISDGPFAGADRHNGEIVAFHIGRLLGFNRIPMAAGRKFTLKELKEKSTMILRDTFFKKGDEWCFYGKCRYCKRKNAVCGTSGSLEGAIVLLLPNKYALQSQRSPWQRTYRKGVHARWETDPYYCDGVRHMQDLSGRRMFDLIDSAIFDFLIQNADRHHIETIYGYPESIVLLLDNGKSFGDPYTDDFSILAPLYQCCLLRNGTYHKLLMFMNELGNSVDRVTQYDPLYPLLTADHLRALDRRLRLVLATVIHCKFTTGLQLGY